MFKVCRQFKNQSLKRHGQALIEFSIVAFVLTLLLGAMITLGFLFFSANVLQQAADVGAMELSRTPVSPVANFDQGLAASGLFDEVALVVPTDQDASTLPLINRLLFPLYIFDPDVNMLRYPGTLVTNAAGDQTVVIPIVGTGNRDPSTGVETISEWRRVVEEIIPAGATQGPYSLSSPTAGGVDPGTVALRINYPFQSAALVAYDYQDENGNSVAPNQTIGVEGIQNLPVVASDGLVQGDSTATFPNGDTLTDAGYAIVDPTANSAFGASPHRGRYGLGESQAFATTVRPYRKVISAQAIYRREVFGN